MSDRAVAKGNVVSGGNTTIGAYSSVKGDITSIGEVWLRSSATVEGNVITEGTISKQEGAVVEGEEKEYQDITVPGIPDIDPFTTGSQDIEVSNNQSLQLQPGDYRNIIVRAGATLFFSKGTYNFSSFNIEPDVSVNFDHSVSEEISVNVSDNFQIGSRVHFNLTSNGSAANINFNYKGTNTVFIDTDTEIRGNYTLPDSKINCANRSVINGTISAKSIYIAEDAIVQPIHEEEPEYSITPVFEGVIDNCDGVYTAIWGYNNTGMETINIPVGINNTFSEDNPDLGQPTEFKPGRVKDAFRTDITSSGLEWNIRDATATASIDNPMNVCRLPVKPILNSIVNEGNGNYRAYFGYQNPNDEPVTIERGDRNRFTSYLSGNTYESQIEVFEPGTHNSVFSVEFDRIPLFMRVVANLHHEPDLVWSLDGRVQRVFASDAYYMRLPQSVIEKDIPVDALSWSVDRVNRIFDDILQTGIREDVFYDIVEEVMSSFPDFESVFGADGTLQPILDDYPGATESEIEENYHDIISIYKSAIRYEIVQKIKDALMEQGLGKIADGSTNDTPNGDEIKVMLEYPLCIIPTKDATDAVTNKVNDLEMFGNAKEDNTKSNAFKHSLWNAYIVNECGEYFNSVESAILYAKEFTTAHETGSGAYGTKSSEMDMHNNKAGRIYVESVAETDGAFIFKSVTTPSKDVLSSYLLNEALYNSYEAETIDEIRCSAPDLLVYTDPKRDKYCEDTDFLCEPVTCVIDPDEYTAEVYVEKPRVIGRMISEVVTVPITMSNAVCSSPSWLFNVFCRVVTQTVMREVVQENFVQPVIENFSSHEVQVMVENPESVSTEESRKANTGDIVEFQRWEGSAATYLEDPNSAETEITVPSDAESDELTLQAVYE